MTALPVLPLFYFMQRFSTRLSQEEKIFAPHMRALWLHLHMAHRRLDSKPPLTTILMLSIDKLIREALCAIKWLK